MGADLVLMDIQLPEMDGITATKTLKNNINTKDNPIFALTAYAMKTDRERILNAGCDKYFTKPIDTISLSEEIDLFFTSDQ